MQRYHVSALYSQTACDAVAQCPELLAGLPNGYEEPLRELFSQTACEAVAQCVGRLAESSLKGYERLLKRYWLNANVMPTPLSHEATGYARLKIKLAAAGALPCQQVAR